VTRSEYIRAWRLRNPEKVKKHKMNQRGYWNRVKLKNPERFKQYVIRCSEYYRKWVSQNPDKVEANRIRIRQIRTSRTSEWGRNYYQKHKESIRIATLKYRQKNPEKVKNAWRIRYQKNKENPDFKLKRRVTASRATANLTPGYIRMVLTRGTALASTDIPDELVEIKKLQIQLVRLKKI